MVFEAAQDHAIDLPCSWFVGDKEIDVDCGKRAGTRTILVRSGYGGEVTETAADLVAKNMTEAAEMILGHPGTFS